MTINQYIDWLTPLANEGNEKAARKIEKLRQWKLKHPWSGKQKVTAKNLKP